MGMVSPSSTLLEQPGEKNSPDGDNVVKQGEEKISKEKNSILREQSLSCRLHSKESSFHIYMYIKVGGISPPLCPTLVLKLGVGGLPRTSRNLWW